MTADEKHKQYTPFRKILLEEFNNINAAAYNAEEEVLKAERYWKASDTLNRLLIAIRRSVASVNRKYNECCENIEKIEKEEAARAEETTRCNKIKIACSLQTNNSSENVLEQLDRFDKREEVEHPDPFDKGNWNKI